MLLLELLCLSKKERSPCEFAFVVEAPIELVTFRAIRMILPSLISVGFHALSSRHIAHTALLRQQRKNKQQL